MEVRLVRRLYIAVLVSLAFCLLWATQNDVQAAAPDMPINTFIELNVNNITQANNTIAFIESQGGKVPLSFAPSVLFAHIPTNADLNAWHSRADIHTIYRGSANLTTDDPQAQLAATVWNHWQQEPPFSLDAPAIVQASQIHVVHDHIAHVTHVEPPRQPRLDWTAQADCDNIAVNRFPNPNCFQTSEYMLGSYQVDLFLPESNVTSSNTEDWSTQRRDEVVIGVASGLLWWVAVAEKAESALPLSYNLTVHDPFITPVEVQTDHEPILTRSQLSLARSEDRLWIGQLMDNMGYAGSNQYPGIPEHLVAMWQFVDNRRQVMARDWGFVIFVADSFNDDDGFFADGTSFAYASRPGPHMVLTYDNGPNSQQIGAINGIKINFAHELGHIFGAPEEYQISCNPTAHAGYFNVPNSNCENGGLSPLEDSVMRSPLNQRVAFTNVEMPMSIRRMAGWQDSDKDGLVDPLDTTPALHISGPVVLTDGRYRYVGNTVDIPFSVPTERITRTIRTPSTINSIISAEYRLDGQSWQPCLFDDGSFSPDISSANFSCEFIPPSGNGHTVEFRSQNSVGNYSQTLVQTLDEQPSLNKAPQGAIALSGGAENVLGSPTAHLVLSALDDQPLSQEGAYRLQYDGVWQAWKSYREHVYLALNPVSGEHPIIVQYRDRQGNTSPEYSTTVLLDQELPACAISDVDFVPNSADVTLKFAHNDAVSGVTKMNLHYYDEATGEGRWHGWQDVVTESTIRLPEDNLYNLTIRCLDQAYNQSQTTMTATVDRLPPAGRIQDIDTVWQDGNVKATIDFVASDTLSGITQYRLYYNGAWQAWQRVDVTFTFAETVQVTIDPTSDRHTFQLQFMDGAGNLSRIDTADIEIRNSAPEGTIQDVEKLWSGNQLNAKIYFIGSATRGGINGYRLFYNGEWHDWVTTDVTFALTDSEVVNIDTTRATQTLQIQFSDTRGNISQRESFALQIGSTTGRSPTGSISFDNLEPLAVGQHRTFGKAQITLAFAAQGYGAEVTQMKIFDGIGWREWEPFAPTWSVELEDGTYNFSTQFRDASDNVSEVIQFEDVVIDTIPPAGSLDVHILSSSAQAELRFQIETTESLDTLQMRLYYDGVWHDWEAYIATKIVDLEQKGLQDFQVQFRDEAQNLSEIYLVPDQPVDTEPPRSWFYSPNDGDDLKITNHTVRWLGVDNRNGSDIRCYDVQYSIDFGETWINWIPCTTETNAPFSGEFGQTYYMRIRAIDNAGNQEPYPDDPEKPYDISFSITPDFGEPIARQRDIYLPIIYRE